MADFNTAIISLNNDQDTAIKINIKIILAIINAFDSTLKDYEKVITKIEKQRIMSINISKERFGSNNRVLINIYDANIILHNKIKKINETTDNNHKKINTIFKKKLFMNIIQNIKNL